jgi:hypothetical protein
MVTLANIAGTWVHAHEKDHDGLNVFVSGTTSLPPSRGRKRLQFLPEGTFLEATASADDRMKGAHGRYSLSGNHLTLMYDEPGRAPRTIEVSVSAVGGIAQLETKRV